MEDKVTKAIEIEIGKIARPKNVRIVPDMPKTRSGKIMRRVIAAISNFTDVGDVTTLANPEVVDGIRDQVQTREGGQGRRAARADRGRASRDQELRVGVAAAESKTSAQAAGAAASSGCRARRLLLLGPGAPVPQ